MNGKIKALFMAQYLGQKAYTSNLAPYEFTLWHQPTSQTTKLVSLKDAAGDLNCCLLLQTVDMLTDEEANMIDFFGSENLKLCLESYGEENFENNFIRTKQHQILISLGVIRPFTYLNEDNQPVTLSPDEIIALGWAKIKTK